MHVAKFTYERSYDNTDTRAGVLTLTHINDGKVVEIWTMWNVGADGFRIENELSGGVVFKAGYGMHDLCWGWLINKAVEIEELND